MSQEYLNQLLHLGTGGLFALLIIKTVLSFIRSNQSENLKQRIARDEIFEKTMATISQNIERHTAVLQQLHVQTSITVEVVRALSGEIKEIQHKINKISVVRNVN